MLEPKKITKIEKVVVQGPPQIKIVPKESIRVIYKDLPAPAIVEDNNAVVTAVCDIPPSPQGGTAVSVLTHTDNVATGHIEFKPKKVPFFQVKRELGLRAGGGTGGLLLGEIYARPIFLGPLAIEVRGFARRDDLSGADFGAAILGDVRF